MTLPGRFSLFSALLLLMLVFEAYTDVVSWVDENGVRHYSNVGGSGSSSDVKKMEEYNSTPSGERTKPERDRFGVLKMYENDRKKYQEKEKKALIKKLEREEAASNEAAKIRMEKIRNEIKKSMKEARKIDERLKKR